MYFTLKNETPLRSSDAVIREYSHASGATLLYLDNGAEEKAFAAAFKTIPFDSTGVFHILEHSVLAGSENYPVSSPILFMMKNSMQTYLNALTYQGKTMYPVASCNEKDFENLMKVYLDAVFKPKLSEEIFLREGWHLEKNGSEYALSGVVFNEMKGAMSSTDRMLYHYAEADFAPGTYLAENSGGDPDAIPSLTYEGYLQTYRSFYSTNNCVLMLSGKMDLDRVFPIIDRWLGEASRCDDFHDYQPMPVGKVENTHYFPVENEQQTVKNTHLALGFACGTYADEKRSYASSVLVSYLLGDATSALRKRLMESGLCGSADGDTLGMKENGIILTVNNIEEKDREAILALIRDELEKQAKGMDREKLSALLESYAFNVKEQLSLLSTQAVESFSTLSNNFFFGVPLNAYFEFDGVLDQLRKGVSEGYYEDLLRSTFLENPHTSVTTMIPVVKDPSAISAERIEKVLSSMTEEQIAQAIEKSARFLAHAAQEDTPEQIAKMPRLSLSDLDPTPKPTTLKAKDGLLLTDLPTAGIVYSRMYFDLSGLSEEELTALPLLSEAIGQISTGKRGGEALSTKIRSVIGRFGIYPSVCGRSAEEARASLVVSTAFMREKGKETGALLDEMLNDPKFLPEELAPILRQEAAEIRNNIAYSGLSLAISTANAYHSRSARYRAAFSDLRYLPFLDRYENDLPSLCALLGTICRKLFVSSRLTVGITGKEEDRLFLPAFPEGKIEGKTEFSPVCASTAVAIRSEVSYNVRSIRFDDLLPYDGRCVVFEKLISLGYLWHKIRETGGAYGTGMVFSHAGTMIVYSYRDPSVAKTYETFGALADFFRQTAFDRREVEGCIISSAADYFKPKNAESEGAENETNYFLGFGYEETKKLLSEILSFDPEEPATRKILTALLDRLASGKGSRCSVGSGEKQNESGLFEKQIRIDPN